LANPQYEFLTSDYESETPDAPPQAGCLTTWLYSNR